MASSRELLRDPDEMSRRELQVALNVWDLPATGTTAALRTRYSNERDKRISALQLQPPASNPSSLLSCPIGYSTPIKSTSNFASRMKTSSIAATSTAIASDGLPDVLQGKKRKKASPKEKRLKRYRSNCPGPVRQRIDRAKTQRMYLVKCGDIQEDLRCEFVVLGSTGNVYTVSIQRIPSCTCPDYAKGNLCKHILFVLLKVMSLDPNSPLIYQAAWIESELRAMFGQMLIRFRNVSGAYNNVMANEAVRATFAKLERGDDVEDDDDNNNKDGNHAARKAMEEDDCPICYDPMVKTEATTYCRARCGANFHQECIRGWLRQQGQKATCPMCREPWEVKSVASPEGYTNLGKLQGQQSTRDTSTYHYSTYNYKRRRYR